MSQGNCSYCGFPLPANGRGGLRHYGTHTAHAESECLRLLQAEIERLRKDAARLDWLETLLHRTEYQNQRRPAESVSSDMHFAHGNCNLYVRNLFGNATTGAGGGGDSVRAAIDAAMMKAKT